MTVWDVLLLTMVAFCIFMACRSLHRRGGCSGDCANCRKQSVHEAAGPKK